MKRFLFLTLFLWVGILNAQLAPGTAQYFENNMLKNPSFEQGRTGWTCTTGTCSITSTGSEVSDLLNAMKIVPAANVLNVSQTITTIAGLQSQGFARIIYRVPSTCSTSFVIRTLVNGSTQSEVPTNRLIFDDKYHEIEIPMVFSTTSAGIQVFASGTCTGNIFIDGAVIAQGLGVQNLMLDNTFSFLVTTTAGSVSSENKDFIASCTAANPTVCTFNTGYFTVAPNCNPGSNGIAAAGFRVSAVSATSVSIESFNTTTGNPLANQSVALFCQKSGVDYLNSSASVYLSTNSSTQSSIISQVATFGNVDITGSLTTSVGSGCYTYSSGTGIYTANNNCNIAISATFRNAAAASTEVMIYKNASIVAADTSAAAAQAKASSSAGFNVTLGDTFKVYNNSTNSTSEQWISVIATPSSNFIVGSFAGVPSVPGYQGLVDTFSVSFGTTNSTTVCSASPCSYLDQIGTAVSSITRTTNGRYALNTSRTYTRLKCNAGFNATTNVFGQSLSCLSCNSLPFDSVITTVGGGFADSYGTILCQGTY